MEPLPPPLRLREESDDGVRLDRSSTAKVGANEGTKSPFALDPPMNSSNSGVAFFYRESRPDATEKGMDPLPPPKKTHSSSSSSLSSIQEPEESSSSSDSDSTATQRGKRSPSFILDPYDDDYGLEHPPPAYNLEGEWNYSRKTGRRTLTSRAKNFYPFHHIPVVYIDRQPCSNAAYQVISKINEMKSDAMEDSFEDVGVVEAELRRLDEVQHFVQDSVALDEWDCSGRGRSVEDRMEEILKVYGFDRVERKGKDAVRD